MEEKKTLMTREGQSLYWATIDQEQVVVWKPVDCVPNYLNSITIKGGVCEKEEVEGFYFIAFGKASGSLKFQRLHVQQVTKPKKDFGGLFRVDDIRKLDNCILANGRLFKAVEAINDWMIGDLVQLAYDNLADIGKYLLYNLRLNYAAYFKTLGDWRMPHLAGSVKKLDQSICQEFIVESVNLKQKLVTCTNRDKYQALKNFGLLTNLHKGEAVRHRKFLTTDGKREIVQEEIRLVDGKDVVPVQRLY